MMQFLHENREGDGFGCAPPCHLRYHYHLIIKNEEAAALCRAHPDRFSFSACLPMPEIEASIDELRYAYDELGAVVVPHTGSFLPLIIHRLTGISKVLGPKGLIPETDVWAAFRTLYFDTAGDSQTVALRTLLSVADPTHILYGGDFPYTPVDQIQSA